MISGKEVRVYQSADLKTLTSSLSNNNLDRGARSVPREEIISLDIVTNTDRFLEMESAWNNFITTHTETPFLLSGFVKQFMEFYQGQGWIPTLLVISVNHVIVGIAPLMTRTKLGVRKAELLLTSSYFPDFIFEEQYRQPCIDRTLDFLFNVLNCQSVSLTLPSESANIAGLKRNREDRGMKFFTKQEMGHRAIPVKCTWTEFEKSRGKKFRGDFKRTERKLDNAGSWKVRRFEKAKEETEIVNKILDVEKVSWKEKWRRSMGLRIDHVLMMVLRGSRYTAETETGFKRKVWFLELNNKPIAYVLVIQYKGVAYLTKTSHDAHHRRFSPGIYIWNVALRELFNGDQVRKIDLHTDFPWMGTWTSLCLPRVGVFMPKGRVLTALISLGRSNRAIRSILTSLPKKPPFIADINRWIAV